MASGRARVMQLTDPRKVRIQHQNKRAWSEVWENNPRIAGPSEEGDFQILYARSVSSNMRPYHLAKSPQKWTYNLAFRPDVGELYFSDAEKSFGQQFAPQVIVEPNIKAAASPNKRWPWERWQAFASMATKAGIRLYQVGPPGTRKLIGVALIDTKSFRLACAVLARAKAYVGGEGGLHHAAAALGVPGVVVMGGFTPLELTGYSLHRNLGVSLGDACGMRMPCAHCAREMARITPDEVFKQLMEVLK